MKDMVEFEKFFFHANIIFDDGQKMTYVYEAPPCINDYLKDLVKEHGEATVVFTTIRDGDD